ncbi:hypothetical protein T4B_5969 [Trichinella pseudospiralis]|uniref:Uncharacterized protein n=1 Tax=Trichinella pseudospiralis TaxID=6337 RepID=A0A0V1IW76_TRIPS|nr:hypothetical protein T4B_5969 [Trichinella pseudospiralis]
MKFFISCPLHDDAQIMTAVQRQILLGRPILQQWRYLGGICLSHSNAMPCRNRRKLKQMPRYKDSIKNSG